MNKNDDYDPDLDYYFPPKRRSFIGRLVGAIMARLKAAGRGNKRTRRPASVRRAPYHSQERA